MISKINLGLLAFLFVQHSLFAQTPPSIQWQKVYGGIHAEEFTSLEITGNGEFLLGGSSLSDSTGNKTTKGYGYADYWLVKINNSGNCIWQNEFGGNDLDALTSIKMATDAGIVVGGYSTSGISGNKTDSCRGGGDFWILKVDSLGSLEWQRTFGGTFPDQLNCIEKSKNGGFLIGGNSSSEVNGDKADSCRGADDFWIIKISEIGNIEWQKTIGGDQMDILRLIRQTPDGGYLLGGESMSDSSGDKTETTRGFFDYWFVRIDSVGNILWQRAYGGNNYDAPFALEITTDGGFITGGVSISNISGEKSENSRGGEDYWVIKADSIGTIQWQKTYGGTGGDLLTTILHTPDGGFLIGGNSTSDISGEKTENNRGSAQTGDYWIVKIDTLGTIQWQKTIGGSENDLLGSVRNTMEGGYMLGGFSNSPVSGEKTENLFGYPDYWIVKLAGPVGMDEFNSTIAKINIYPNPVNQFFTVKWSLPSTENILFYLYDATGRVVLTSNSLHGEKEMNILTQDIPSGLYFWKVSNKDCSDQNGKIVILR